jgi:hypothetical protein
MVSEQVLADYNVLSERLQRRDAVINKQRLQLHQLRGAPASTAAASSECGTAPAAAEFTPAAAAAQEMHRRNERSWPQAPGHTPHTHQVTPVCQQQCHTLAGIGNAGMLRQRDQRLIS